MKNRTASVKRFFAAYQRAFNQALQSPRAFDPKSIANAFTKHFVGASPRGVQAGKNGLMFRMMLRRSMAAYLRTGLTSMTAASLKVLPMHQQHAMVKVHWVAHYEKDDGSKTTLAFDNFYALQWLKGSTPRIFAFVTPDEEQELQARGLT